MNLGREESYGKRGMSSVSPQTAAEVAPQTAAEVVIENLRRDLALALRLRELQETRAQILSGAVAVIVAVVGVVLAADPATAQKASSAVATIAIALLVVSLASSLVVSFPAKIKLVNPKWYRDNLAPDSRFYEPLDRRAGRIKSKVVAKMVQGDVGLLESVTDVILRRQQLLLLSYWCLFAGSTLIGIIGLEVLL